MSLLFDYYFALFHLSCLKYIKKLLTIYNMLQKHCEICQEVYLKFIIENLCCRSLLPKVIFRVLKKPEQSYLVKII